MTIIDKTATKTTALSNLATGSAFTVPHEAENYISTFHTGIFFISREMNPGDDDYSFVVTNLFTGQTYQTGTSYTDWKDENDDFLIPFPDKLEVIPVKASLIIENY